MIRLIALLGLALALACPFSAAAPHDDPAMPGGVRGARIAALLVAANDVSKVPAFFAEHTAAEFRDMATMAQHQQTFHGVYQMTGGVDFRAIRRPSAGNPVTTVLVQDRLLGKLHEVLVDFDADAGQRIKGLDFRPADDAVPSPRTPGDAVAAIRRYFDAACAKGLFSGSALLARDDKVLFETSCGEASKRYRVANNIDTRFNLGSMNKMFTAVTIARLVEQGKLAYADTVDKYIDESWLPKEVTRTITVHHLLTHTSGLGNFFNDRYNKTSRALLRTVDDFKPLVQGDAPAFAPGQRFKYSNTGMLLLGVVIEKVSGQNYFDAVRTHVYGPAAMADSDSYAMDEPVPNLAMGYFPDHSSPLRWRENTFEHVIRGGPAGGGFSTVRDLHRFVQALRTGKLLKPESVRTLWTDHSGKGYGYGFMLGSGPAGNSIGHEGGFLGINAALRTYPDTGYTVAVMSNHSHGAGSFAFNMGAMLQQIVEK